MTIHAGLQAKRFHTCATRLRYQRVQDFAGYSPASCALLHPHSLNLGPTNLKNESASRDSFTLRITCYEETNLRLPKIIKRDVVIALVRVEPCRFCLSIL